MTVAVTVAVATIIVALVACIEGWLTRVIAAYDRRTDALSSTRMGRINAERGLFYEWLKLQRRREDERRP